MKKDRSITTTTQLCAVIGNPVAHSLSPAIHNAAFNELGLDFVYVAFRVEALGKALDGMRSLQNFRGMSVTIPHKIEAMKFVDEIAEVDRAIGSINTIINENGKLVGLGTDGPGALKSLVDAGVKLAGKNILMLGAGGAARAIAFTLAQKAHPGKIVLLDVNETLLNGLVSDLKTGTETMIASGALNATVLQQAMPEADVIINCTPIGMHPHEGVSLVPVELYRAGQVVFDVVYTPLETKLLADARSRGLVTVSGVEMFINQAVMQFERFTGAEAPVEVMRRVVMEKLNS
ncbi:shikimate dehydrogenase [Geobacter pelophilus]|uniref:Shikimate dehydrogenase (NADP(+)) n=1 Tax=Geoanaerobacter pelophilus TaxID=60036 RepID=A0AAW4KZQ1_9BACT|nr:shikimate dehydrogenase [Geoanaerobacter pelophilus]MBT0663030.1 shikimate dehydrogenase [Geoanaerobacter pelophilus]